MLLYRHKAFLYHPEIAAAQESSDQRTAVLRRIQELELEGALPERREAAKARRKLVKDVQLLNGDSGLTSDDKIGWLQNKLLELVCSWLFGAATVHTFTKATSHMLLLIGSGCQPGQAGEGADSPEETRISVNARKGGR